MNQRIKGPATKPPLPGSWRMRNNARKRTATWIDGDEWLVTGGENPHKVIAGKYGCPSTFACDCNPSKQNKDGLCCHILAVMWEM